MSNKILPSRVLSKTSSRKVVDGILITEMDVQKKTSIYDDPKLHTIGVCQKMLPRKLRQKTNSKFCGMIFFSILITIFALLYYVVAVYNSDEAVKAREMAMTQKENQALLDRLSKHMILPEGVPVVYTVDDPAQLKSQSAFFKNVQLGDKLLVFSESQEAIIFSEARDLIVNVGPISGSGGSD